MEQTGYQAKLPLLKISEGDMKNLKIALGEIYQNIKIKFESIEKLEKVLIGGNTHSSAVIEGRQAPEEFSKQNIIEPLLDLLGYDVTPEIILPAPGGIKKPDYIIKPAHEGKILLYMEAEPINVRLEHNRGHGLDQVNTWLLSRASKTDYGIATDGFKWILVRFNTSTNKSDIILSTDLVPVFQKIHNPRCFIDEEQIDEAIKNFLFFNVKNILNVTNKLVERIEEEKERISKSFYNNYVRFVFGVDELGRKLRGRSILSSIVTPRGLEEPEERLFAVIFMNRLIFIRFLEEKGLVPKNLLRRLYRAYQKTQPPASFYSTYLIPLFYDIFNRQKDKRGVDLIANPLYNKIPYLNGGLFRETIPDEKRYNIENDGIELVLDQIIERYSFSMNGGEGLDPDILGYVFEKTINYISGTGTNEQKMKGAYYTPDDVVSFIIEKTAVPIVYRKMIEALRKAGWGDADLRSYNTIEDILENPPNNPIHIKNIIEEIETIKILDPACGSGHFITAALSEILRIEEFLLKIIGEDFERYNLKKDIISKNLFGVDIDENAVEIARLRLWLSLIEEVSDDQHVETLPNIDFNILSGNSLVGWQDEKLAIHPFVELLKDTYVNDFLNLLYSYYPDTVEEVKKLLKNRGVDDVIRAYKKLTNIYIFESGSCAANIQNVLERIKDELYEVIKKSYFYYISNHTDLSKKDWKLIEKSISERSPFHWNVNFGDVMGSGGFDIIVGNPPYIEDGNYNETDKIFIKSQKNSNNRKGETEPLFYNSWRCGNTHAYFIERSIKLLKLGGKFGFIVPLALVSTDRMSTIREFIQNNSSEVYYYNFDDRPGKIFSGQEDCRSTIVITERGAGTNMINTSKYHRWFTRDRATLFENLKTVDWVVTNSGDNAPKIGTEIEKSIIDKMFIKSNRKMLKNYITTDGVGVWYHNAPRYWIHVHPEENLPKAEYYRYEEGDRRGEIKLRELFDAKISSHYKRVLIKESHKEIILGLLNSNLFYWWFILWSDGRDLLDQHIKSFPMDLKTFPDNLKEQLQSLVTELMTDYGKNSKEKINIRRGGYVLKYKEYKPSISKSIIDKIDSIFAEYFDFTEDELNYILNFDREFRIS